MSGSASAGRKATALCLAAVVASVLAIMLAPAARPRSLRPPGAAKAAIMLAPPCVCEASDRRGRPSRRDRALGIQRGLGMVERRLRRVPDGKPPHAEGGRDHAGLALGQSIPRGVGIRRGGPRDLQLVDERCPVRRDAEVHEEADHAALQSSGVGPGSGAHLCAGKRRAVHLSAASPVRQRLEGLRQGRGHPLSEREGDRGLERAQHRDLLVPGGRSHPLLGHPQRRPRRSPRRGQARLRS